VDEPPILGALEVVPSGKGVRVEFTKLDGVISHTIYLVNGEQKVPVLISQINSPGQPCFTELHQQGDMLFLTGADGPCHWSMSVESRQDSSGNSLLFDVACRIKEPGLKLSTEYSVHSTDGEWCVEPFDANTNVEVVDDSSVRILPASRVPPTVPATVRWKYGVFPTRY
jgi:hypothetical protein